MFDIQEELKKLPGKPGVYIMHDETDEIIYVGKAISLMNKPECYLMINLQDNQDLYFGGKKLDKGAYVEVKVLGAVDSGASSKMTAKVCEILDKELGIPGDAVYVSYFGTSNWGWNGSNF